MFKIGPQTTFSDNLHSMKYRSPGEDFRESMNRVAFGLKDSDKHYHELRDILLHQRFLPAGRIQSAVGSTKAVTLYNCYVSGTIADSFVDGPGNIMQRAAEAAATMRMGGGIGYDFSTLRPRGELITKLQSQSSGPVSFMEIFNAVCLATCSSGHRRGAQMGVLRVDHPDIEEFIHAKNNDNKLTGFNISIAVTDDFMEAVINGKEFPLQWNGKVYRHIDAATLWEKIMRSTFDWAEPGVVFIDTINKMNNLYYCETIASTNPCCLTGDTLVDVAGRGPVPIRQLAEEGKDVPVFAKNKMSSVTHVSWGRAARWVRKAKIVRVTLDDGSYIRCSDDHHFPLRDGRRIKARDLVPGDSLFRHDRASHHLSKEVIVDGKTEHHMIAEAKFGREFDWGQAADKYQVHHLNHDHFDNSWDNIEVMTSVEHTRYHHVGAVRSEETKRRIGEKTSERLSTKEQRFQHALATKNGMTHEVRDKIKASRASMFMAIKKVCEQCGTEFSVRAASPDTPVGQRRFCCQKCAVTFANKSRAGIPLSEERRQAISEQQKGREHSAEHNARVSAGLKRYHTDETAQPVNHKVVSVEPDGFEDVYNITVDIYHNYAIVTSQNKSGMSGVFTENSEQPLPPYGACLLGSFNLVKYIRPKLAPAGNSPWSFDFDQIREDVPIAVRALDNSIDRARYPLAEQRAEAVTKRRMGLGITGLANAAETLGYAYGSDDFITFEEQVLETINVAAYQASTNLAAEKGPFPLFDEGRYLQSNFVKTLPEEVQYAVRRYGIRNSHLTSIAPTGTISLCADNVSSALEPVFSYETERPINTPTGMTVEVIKDYGKGFLMTQGKLAKDVTADEHLRVLTAAQKYIDSAVSKTINMRGDTMPWADFKMIYQNAWEKGAKGCSTFNMTGKRGSLLSSAEDTDTDTESATACYFDPDTGMRSCE